MGQPGFASLRRLFSTTMTFLGAGCMLGVSLLTWNTWLASRPGIVLKPDTHYDFIIVGAGTAGCVLAARLSEDPKRTVLLLESGSEFGWLASVPLAAPLLQNTVNDWAFRTVPQSQSSQGLRNRSSAWPRGRGLGGSGQLNYMVHFPGLCSDLARWKSAGVLGWNCDILKSIMNRMTCARVSAWVPPHRCASPSYQQLLQGEKTDKVCPPRRFRCEPKLRLGGGEIASGDLTRAFVAAGHELGAPVCASEFSEYAFRGSRSSVYDGRRWSSLESYLRPALGRPNLHVMLSTHVAKVVFSAALGTSERRAEGVLLTSGAVVLARREVILSAGTLGSAQLLLLSGVGPAHHLHTIKVPQVVESPVGKNLHDHLNMPLYVSFTQRGLSLTLSKLRSIRQLANYLLRKKGLLASTAITGAAVWPPHSGLMLFEMGTPDEENLGAIANYLPETFHGLFPLAGNASQEGAVILASCLQPLSRGTITLKDADPTSAPVIDPRYLTDPSDVTCLTLAYRLAVSVAESKAFQRLGARAHLPKLPNCGKPDVTSDAYIGCVIRSAAITGYHPAGTCPMGRAGRHSVLDSQFRVRGVTGLRVVDASVLPTPTSGTPNSVLLAIAERAANQLIIEYAAADFSSSEN